MKGAVDMAEIILVSSGKGGSGKSSFTAGVSRALAFNGYKVLAIDCDVGLRSLDLLLGVSDRVVFDWGDVILGRCTVDKAIVSGEVSLLAAPPRFNDAFSAEAFAKLVKSVKSEFDYIFIDSPAGIDRGFQIAAAGAEKAVVVTTPDSVCVRSCGRAFDELYASGLTDVRLIINMFEVKPVCKRKLLNIDQCIDETGVQLLGVVPRDPNLGYCSVTGITPSEFSPSTLAYSRIAKRLTGKRVPLVCE